MLSMKWMPEMFLSPWSRIGLRGVEDIHPLEHTIRNRFQLDLPPDIQFFAMTTMSFVERATK